MPIKKQDIFAETKQEITAACKLLQQNSDLVGDFMMQQAMKAELRGFEKFVSLMNHEYVHFLLPDNGASVMDLIEGKSLSHVIKDYIAGSHLPFERVCFEFELSEELKSISNVRAVVVMAHEEMITDGTVRAIVLNTALQTNEKSVFGNKGSKYHASPNTQPSYIIIDENYLAKQTGEPCGLCISDGKTQVQNYHNKDHFTDTSMIVFQTVVAALAALSCSNVRIEKGFPPSLMDNKARIKKGHVPHTQKNFITFSVVTEIHGANPNKGSHTKKSTHIRRGHIRRYQSGKKIWVESTVINGGAGEVKPKKYKIQ